MVSKWVDKNVRYIFSLPAVLFVALMVVFPLAYTGWLSFHEWSMSGTEAPKWVGLENYLALIKDTRFWEATGRTLYFSFGVVVAETLLGVLIALLLNRSFKFKNLVKTLFLLPMVSTPVAIAMVWMLIYEPTVGFANFLLGKFGIDPQLWLASSSTVLHSLMLVDIWEWTPMITLIVLGGMTTLQSEPYESAVVDGANRWQIFWKITFPLLLPTIVVAMLLRMIDALKTFDLIYATTQGGPGNSSETLNTYGYVLGFSFFKVGLASALIMLFLLLVAMVSLFFVYVRKKAGVDQ
ncbi:carbohydrate ABC transporter permease [Paenibacillus eucommiae]|uniref:Multiple sugar transport system permease protein n=1 Tax=Paenibacillus eucommiae TaxID=1355755 RepID=A0ABS4INJ7_9BACL|nr:sugar ABC transporter permease [Paenibacillus eucommiae]MBP1989139.1 multiple sugar transport system permease protein [Paenibacillus eucommiae]